MLLIGADLLDAYKKRRPETRAPLDRWRTVVEETIFRSVHDVRRTFSKTYDCVPPRCQIFDIAAGRHRLAAFIDFKSRIIKVDMIMDHKRYDRWSGS